MESPISPVPPPPIVVADSGTAFEMLGRSLAGGFSLAQVRTLREATALVSAHTPLVLCECHFDDGRMYDLLRYMKSQAALGAVPFLAVRMQEGELDDAMYESVEIATHALGANGFIDLFRWRQRQGPAEAGRMLAQRVAALAGSR